MVIKLVGLLEAKINSNEDDPMKIADCGYEPL